MFTTELIRDAQQRISGHIIRTPLLRLPALDCFLGCRVYGKLETMQITGSFKLRGALNRVLSLTREELDRGIVAASSGNHGRGVAYAARMLGAKATIVMPWSAPAVKVDAIRALGAEVRQCDVTERFALASELCARQGATLIPPYNDLSIMAGQGTIGLEIARQQPDLDAVVIPVSGGGLFSGVSQALRSELPGIRIYGAEPAALPRYGASLAAGQPVTVEQKSTLADALLSQRPGDLCFPVVRQNATAVVAVEDTFLLRAMKLLLTEGKLLAEPSSCIGMGAVLQGTLRFRATDRVCFLLSGGNVGLEQLRMLEGITL